LPLIRLAGYAGQLMGGTLLGCVLNCYSLIKWVFLLCILLIGSSYEAFILIEFYGLLTQIIYIYMILSFLVD
jgi:hypothetical protein